MFLNISSAALILIKVFLLPNDVMLVFGRYYEQRSSAMKIECECLLNNQKTGLTELLRRPVSDFHIAWTLFFYHNNVRLKLTFKMSRKHLSAETVS